MHVHDPKVTRKDLRRISDLLVCGSGRRPTGLSFLAGSGGILWKRGRAQLGQFRPAKLLPDPGIKRRQTLFRGFSRSRFLYCSPATNDLDAERGPEGRVQSFSCISSSRDQIDSDSLPFANSVRPGPAVRAHQGADAPRKPLSGESVPDPSAELAFYRTPR